MDEVRAALKEMKRHKAPGLSGLVTEMIQATGEIGTLKLGNQVWYCQSTKVKATLWSVDLTEGSNCWNML